jgi:hypothetical protein
MRRHDRSSSESTSERSLFVSYEISYDESPTVDVREHLTADGKNPYREYRIYFFKDGAQFVLLLLGADKSTQTADVTRAQDFWKAYQEGKPRGKTK